jgi:hypothetical protein
VREAVKPSGISIAVWISIIALISSVTVPLFLDQRQAPRVRARISPLVALANKDVREYISISAVNRGRSSVTVNQIKLSYWSPKDRKEVILVILSPEFEYGSGLPHKLEPYSNASFGILGSKVLEMLPDVPGVRVRALLELSNGYRIITRRTLKLDSSIRMPNNSSYLRRFSRWVFAKERSPS